MASSSFWNSSNTLSSASENSSMDPGLIEGLKKLRLGVESVRRLWNTPASQDQDTVVKYHELGHPLPFYNLWSPLPEECLPLKNWENSFPDFPTLRPLQPEVADTTFFPDTYSYSIPSSIDYSKMDQSNREFRETINRILLDANIEILKLKSDTPIRLVGSVVSAPEIPALPALKTWEPVTVDLLELTPGSTPNPNAIRRRLETELDTELRITADYYPDWGVSFGRGKQNLDEDVDPSVSAPASYDSMLVEPGSSSSPTPSTSAAAGSGSGSGTNDTGEINDSPDPEKSSSEEVDIGRGLSFVPLRAKDFVIFRTNMFQFIFSKSRFVIQPLPLNPEDQNKCSALPTPLKAMVQDPWGFEYEIDLKTLSPIRNTFFGEFYPYIPGFYAVSVFANNVKQEAITREHVAGSPFVVCACRNYNSESAIINLQIGISAVHDSGRNRGRCWGVATDKLTDNFYITNREKHDVTAFNSYGQFMFKFGQGNHLATGTGRSNESLFRPTGLACDSVNRRLLVADKDNHRVVIYSLDGGYIGSFGELGYQNGQFMFPWDVDCSPDGNKVVVADSKNHRVQLFDRFSNFLCKFSVFETNPYDFKSILDNPRGVSFDHEGMKVYVTDFNQDAVICINAELTESKKFFVNGRFGRLQGLTVDDVGNLIVCDTRRNLILVINPEGQVVSTIETLENEVLIQPLDITVMRGGYIAVMDYNGRVRVF